VPCCHKYILQWLCFSHIMLQLSSFQLLSSVLFCFSPHFFKKKFISPVPNSRNRAHFGVLCDERQRREKWRAIPSPHWQWMDPMKSSCCSNPIASPSSFSDSLTQPAKSGLPRLVRFGTCHSREDGRPVIEYVLAIPLPSFHSLSIPNGSFGTPEYSFAHSVALLFSRLWTATS
jgi:hypothetical protein